MKIHNSQVGMKEFKKCGEKFQIGLDFDNVVFVMIHNKNPNCECMLCNRLAYALFKHIEELKHGK